MAEEQAAKAIQMLYSDAGIREDLIDEEADVLLKWAEGEIRALAIHPQKQEPFPDAFGKLRKMVTQMSRYVGRRGNMSPQEQLDALGEIAALGKSLGYPVERPAAQAQADLGTMDNMAAIKALTAMLKPPDEPSALNPPAEGGLLAGLKNLLGGDKADSQETPSDG
jgi:hypothetical protein